MNLLQRHTARTSRCFRTNHEGDILLSNDWPALLESLHVLGDWYVQSRHPYGRLVSRMPLPAWKKDNSGTLVSDGAVRFYHNSMVELVQMNLRLHVLASHSHTRMPHGLQFKASLLSSPPARQAKDSLCVEPLSHALDNDVRMFWGPNLPPGGGVGMQEVRVAALLLAHAEISLSRRAGLICLRTSSPN